MGLLIGWDVNDEGVALYCGFCFLLGGGVSSFYVYSLLGAFLAPYSIYLSLLIKKMVAKMHDNVVLRFLFFAWWGVSSFYVYSLLGAFLAPYSIYLSLLIKKIVDKMHDNVLFFHTAEAKRQLIAAGFQLLNENEEWDLRPGGRYLFTRNMSSLVAFSIGEK